MSLPNEVNLHHLGSTGYNIARSVRTRSSASAYFNRTPASAGTRTTWTWSAWVKLGLYSGTTTLFSGASDGSNQTMVSWRADGLQIYTSSAGALVGSIVWTDGILRDYSAWYHLVFVFDTTQATDTNRMKCYVNNRRLTSISGTAGEKDWPAQNAVSNINNNVAHSIGRRQSTANEYYDGLMTEMNFIDAQALTPSSFGETDTDTGAWKPKRYSGTYGTNGFYLNFSDNSASTAATIGKDYSGNGNNWTPNNISVTAGTTYDSMTDVPTLTSATAANYAVLNPLAVDASSPPTITNGNLAISSTGALATIPMPTGKWYWEATCTSTDADQAVGAYSTSESGKTSISGTSNPTYGFIYQANGNARQNGTVVQTWSTFTNNDILSFTYDASIYELKAYKNNSLVGTITLTTPPSGDSYVPMACCLGGSFAFNFGQRPFSYTPPAGFVGLNTFNIPDSTVKKGNKNFDILTWSGTGGSAGATRSLTGLNFQPDFVWEKNRTSTQDHHIFDAVRGAGLSKTLASNSTGVEGAFNDTSFGYLSSFDSGGVTTTNGSSTWDNWNKSGDTFVAWSWNAGGSTVTNSSGTISSQVRANPTAGFSIVTYTGNGSAGATFGHGLGVAPSFVIVKERGNTNGWLCYHISTGNTGYLELDATLAFQTLSTVWNNTTPSSSVVTLGTVSNVNRSGGTFVAYCFSAVAGYSAFGSYTGNGSNDGPFVYLGFRPRFLLIKNTTTAGTDWEIWDSARDLYNVETNRLYPSSSAAENGGQNAYDFLSNGFKARQAGSTDSNQSGATIIYAAFAENPFKNSLAR